MPMPANVTRLAISGRQPARVPPLRTKTSAEMTMAVTTKSAHTGRPNVWNWSFSQTSGEITTETAAPITTINLPSNQTKVPMTGADALARTSASPAPLTLSAKRESRDTVQLMPKPCRPPPWSRKKAMTGKAMKNRPALRFFAGSRGINSGNSSTAARKKVRLTRHRSASG